MQIYGRDFAKRKKVGKSLSSCWVFYLKASDIRKVTTGSKFPKVAANVAVV
jgi:hypothetical protein